MSYKDEYEYMSVNAKAAYLLGLANGLDLDTSKPEGKLIEAMLDLIFEMTEELEMVEEDLEMIQEDVMDLDDDYYDGDDDNPDYEVVCPDCGAEIMVDEDTLIEGEINCPSCGNVIEFDFSSLYDDDGGEIEEELPF